MDKNALMVCSTYRPEGKPSPLRLFGILHLVEEKQNHQWNGDVKISIVDSSAQPHPFFINPEAFLERGILYLHAPDRNADAPWRRRFPEASEFIPSDAQLETALWKDRKERLQAWDNFLFFTEEFRKIYKGPKPSEFMSFERPCIGMKKNAGIAAMAEIHGNPDYIIFCDDDDRRHPGYIGQVADALHDNDFARMRQWLTLKVDPAGKRTPLWGKYDIPFHRDINNMWSVPVEYRDVLFHSTLKNADGTEFRRSVGSKFSIPLCMGWPPLGHEGALHNYTYAAWHQAVEKFGGCAPTSFCEDMLLYKFCEQYLPSFKVAQIDTQDPMFIRCSDGSNASEVEWTEDVPSDHGYVWAQDAARAIQRNIGTPYTEDALRAAGANFIKTGTIDWNMLFKGPRQISKPSLNPPAP